MNKYITLIRAAAMVLITAAFIFTVQLVRRPSAESISVMLYSMPEYSHMQKMTEPYFGAYLALLSLPIDDLMVYTAADSTAREFAVCRITDHEQLEQVINVFKVRVDELAAEFAGNEEELKRIEYFRIVSINDFVTFTVCDMNATADNAVHEYFNAH